MNLKYHCQSKAEEDYYKDIRRRIKNRESAKKSRLKRCKSMEQLREKYQYLDKKEREAKAQSRDVEDYHQYWESQVQAIEQEVYRKRRKVLTLISFFQNDDVFATPLPTKEAKKQKKSGQYVTPVNVTQTSLHPHQGSSSEPRRSQRLISSSSLDLDFNLQLEDSTVNESIGTHPVTPTVLVSTVSVPTVPVPTVAVPVPTVPVPAPKVTPAGKKVSQPKVVIPAITRSVSAYMRNILQHWNWLILFVNFRCNCWFNSTLFAMIWILKEIGMEFDEPTQDPNWNFVEWFKFFYNKVEKEVVHPEQALRQLFDRYLYDPEKTAAVNRARKRDLLTKHQPVETLLEAISNDLFFSFMRPVVSDSITNDPCVCGHQNFFVQTPSLAVAIFYLRTIRGPDDSIQLMMEEELNKFMMRPCERNGCHRQVKSHVQRKVNQLPPLFVACLNRVTWQESQKVNEDEQRVMVEVVILSSLSFPTSSNPILNFRKKMQEEFSMEMRCHWKQEMVRKLVLTESTVQFSI